MYAELHNKITIRKYYSYKIKTKEQYLFLFLHTFLPKIWQRCMQKKLKKIT